MATANSDHAITTGRSHFVCEDYAVSGRDEDGEPYIIVADGCSGSPDTDVGARLLVKTLEQRFRAARDREATGIDNIYTWSAADALEIAAALGLSQMSCDATLLSAYVVEGFLNAYIYGDGALAIKMREAQAIAHVYSFGDGHPGYVSYAVQAERRELFRNLKGNDKSVAVYTQDDAGGFNLTDEHNLGAERACETFSLDVRELGLEWIALMSDGIMSFDRPVQVGAAQMREPVPVGDVLARFLDFKNMNGKFVQRRLTRFLRTVEREGWRNEDDLSIAVIHFPQGGARHA